MLSDAKSRFGDVHSTAPRSAKRPSELIIFRLLLLHNSAATAIHLGSFAPDSFSAPNPASSSSSPVISSRMYRARTGAATSPRSRPSLILASLSPDLSRTLLACSVPLSPVSCRSHVILRRDQASADPLSCRPIQTRSPSGSTSSNRSWSVGLVEITRGGGRERRLAENKRARSEHAKPRGRIWCGEERGRDDLGSGRARPSSLALPQPGLDSPRARTTLPPSLGRRVRASSLDAYKHLL